MLPLVSPVVSGRESDAELVAGKQRGQVRHRRVAREDDRRPDRVNAPSMGSSLCRRFSDGDNIDRGQRRAVVKVHAGPQPELPAMIVVFRFPIDGESGLRSSVRARSKSAHRRPAAAPARRGAARDRRRSQRAACRRNGDASARRRGDASARPAEANCKAP